MNAHPDDDNQATGKQSGLLPEPGREDEPSPEEVEEDDEQDRKTIEHDSDLPPGEKGINTDGEDG